MKSFRVVAGVMSMAWFVCIACIACNGTPPAAPREAEPGTFVGTPPASVPIPSPPQMQPAPSAVPAPALDASTMAPATEAPSAPMPPVEGLPAGGEAIAGLELMQRLAGKWSGTNSNTPLGFDFPMTVEFAPSDDGFLFGKLQLDASNTVVWGISVETYAGKDVLAYRNGGYLGGVLRDSRTTLVEHDSTRGYYRFCAVRERGVAIEDGCKYIDARYTFDGPDKMLFEVFTRGTEGHVHWAATRQSAVALPTPFPATAQSRGDGSEPWPAAAGIP